MSLAPTATALVSQMVLFVMPTKLAAEIQPMMPPLAVAVATVAPPLNVQTAAKPVTRIIWTRLIFRINPSTRYK